MTTVASLIDRTLREWLEPPGERPPETTLNGAITDNATSLILTDNILSPEDEDAIGPGSLLEINSELIEVVSVTTWPTADSINRGVMGTTAAAHSDNDRVKVIGDSSYRWTRLALFNALADAVEHLSPPLYRTLTQDMSMSESPVEINDERARDVIDYKWWDGTKYASWPVEVLNPYPYVSSQRAVQFQQPVPGGSGYLIYQAEFGRPDAETDDLANDDDDEPFGIPTRWDQLLIVATVATLTSGVDLDAATQEFITRQLEAQGFSVGSGADITNALLGYYEYLLREEERRLIARHDHHSTRRQTKYRVI